MPKISEFLSAAAVVGSELLVLVQSAVTKRITIDELVTYTKSAIGLPLDVRDYGATYDGVSDDLAAWNAMLATIPVSRTRKTKIRIPPGPCYLSGNLEIKRKIDAGGDGKSRDGNSDLNKLSNALIFPPLKGIVLHGSATSGSDGSADQSTLHNFNVVTEQAIASDAAGNWGKAMHQLSTTTSTWTQLPTNVSLGTCVLKTGSTVGSPTSEYYGDGHTRFTQHLVMFRCTSAGTKGSSEPAAFQTAGLAQLGQTILANGSGTAIWTVESLPKDYQNSTAYVVGQRVVVPGDNGHVFECIEAGTSIALEETTIAAGSDGQVLLQLTINVASTDGWPSTGVLCIETQDQGRQFLSYANKTSTSFTTCNNTAFQATSGTMATGDTVTGPYNGAIYGIPVRCAGHFMAPPHAIEFYDIRAVAASTVSLPQTTITVDSTSGFASSGELKIWTGSAYTTVAYTGKTDTTFTDCSGGTGTMTAGNEVGQGPKWREIFGGAITILGNSCIVENVGVFGSTGAAVWITGNHQLTSAGGSNFWRVSQCLFVSCGEGLSLNSNNTNAGTSEDNDQFFLGGGRTNVDAPDYLNIIDTPIVSNWASGRFGNGGGAIKDRTQGNNIHVAQYIQYSGGMPYRNDLLLGAGLGNSTVWQYIVDETDLKSILFSPAVVFGAVSGLHDDTSAVRIGDADSVLANLWTRTSRIWIGGRPGTNTPSIGFATAMPTSGTYVRGSVTWNSAALAGQPTGWMRLTTGSNHVLDTDWRALANL